MSKLEQPATEQATNRRQKMLEEITERLKQGEINPLEAIEQANETFGGIMGSIYRRGFTLENHCKREGIDLRNLTKKQAESMQEFAVLAYWKAQKNGSLRPGEIHLDKGLSTKHYAKGFREYTNKLLEKYQ